VCGIFGVVRMDSLSYSDHELFESISQSLEHRGPDGSGFIDTPLAKIGMHRLSIMDVASGDQPFWSEDRKIGVVGNGEIYNSKELANQLRRAGHTLTTGSDMEVIPHLYEEYGLNFPNRIRGMFALAILDMVKGDLILVRDRLGEKPISFVSRIDQFVFSSEQNSLVRSRLVAPALSAQGLFDYLLHGFSPEPNSIIEGIQKVPAGSILRVNLSSLKYSVTKYWDLIDYADDKEPNSDELLSKIENAVIATTQSDVAVGIALSGGIDSSLIAHFAQQARPDLRAFTIGYGGGGSDESMLALRHAEALGIDCTVTHLDTLEVASTFSAICSARDEPISDIAGPALAAVAGIARENGVPVLLNGIGGDEWFWGYDWVRKLGAFAYGNSTMDRGHSSNYSLLRLYPTPTLTGIAQWLETIGGIRTERAIRKYVESWRTELMSPISLYQFQPGYPKINGSILRLCGESVFGRAPNAYVPNISSQIAPHYMAFLCSTYLRVNSLAQADRLGMFHSVEMRTPLVDYQLAEYVMSTRMRSDGFLGEPPKTEIRAAAANILPNDVLSRPKKGFVPPVRQWVREIWRQNEDALRNPELLLASGLMDNSAVRAEIARPIYRSGRVNQMALRLGTLELWLRGLV